MKYSLIAILAAAFLAATAARAHAAFTFTLTQVGSTVVVVGSGSFNIAALTLTTTAGNQSAGINPFGGQLTAGGGTLIDVYTGVTGPSTFGSGFFTSATTPLGDIVGVTGSLGHLTVPTGYVSGTALADSVTFNKTLSALGANVGTYVYTWGAGATADSLTITVNPAPEPSTWAMLLGGAGVLGLSVRRRARRA